MLYTAFLTLLTGILSAQAQSPVASISSAESSKCLEAGILDIIDGDPVRMLVEQDLILPVQSLILSFLEIRATTNPPARCGKLSRDLQKSN